MIEYGDMREKSPSLARFHQRKSNFSVERLDNCNFLTNFLRKKLIEQLPIPSTINNIMRDKKKLHIDNWKIIGGDIS